jgi:hypothetical protein
MSTVIPRDRSAAEDEITPEMIEAGFRVLDDSGRLIEPPHSGCRLLIRDIYQAMLDARREVRA